jgi:hypothetical protein
MIRFMQQFESGSGDYAQERRTWVDQTDLDEVKRAAEQGDENSAQFRR